jgi:signal transduction histidine kinase
MSTTREAALAERLEKVAQALRHDLRNPLTVISTNAALLLEGELTVEQRRSLVDIRDNSVRLARMFAEMEATIELGPRS